VSQETTTLSSARRRQKLFWLLLDGIALTAICAISFLLIGYYSRFSYLSTGYQDWMFHAFRVESIAQHGLISWDHIWSNGLNHWRSYQYLPHLWTLVLAKLFAAKPAAMMMTAIAISFTLIRIEMYILMRRLHISPLYAFVATAMSFAFIQQWISIKDFSIFVLMPVLPVFIYIWIKAMQHQQFLPLLSAVAGILWLCHPVLGYSAAGLVGFAFIFPAQKLSIKQLVLNVGIYLLTSAAFLGPYLFYGYGYTNPILSLPQFLRSTLVKESMGLSLAYWLAVALSWVGIFIDPEHFKRWSKILLLYCVLYVAAIMAGQAGYLPSFINQLQISRGILIIGLTLPFVFAIMLQTMAPKIEHRFRLGLFAVFTALVVTQSIAISGQYGGQPTNDVENPVSQFFADKNAPTGSVFIEEVAEASFFAGDKARFPISYNEHLEPHPLAQRFRRILKTDLSYSSVSPSQMNLISDYVKVLGVEYVFLPKYSPTVNQFLAEQDPKRFESAGEVQTTYESFAILKAVAPIHYAYLASAQAIKDNVSFAEFEKPGVRANAFEPWDAEIQKNAKFFEQDDVKAVPLSFVKTDELHIAVPSDADIASSELIITQSYDPYWKVIVDGRTLDAAALRPTSLRFMHLKLPNGAAGKTVVLKHEWPVWYWPVQGVSFAGAIGITVFYAVLILSGKMKTGRDPDEMPLILKPKKAPASVPVVKDAVKEAFKHD
jgi:hypothetical protein